MQTYNKSILYIFILCNACSLFPSKSGLIHKPVADIFHTMPTKNIHSPLYKECYSVGVRAYQKEIPRSAQLLLNTIVPIIDEKENYYLIQAPNTFYEMQESPENHYLSNNFWIHKNDIVPIESVEEKFHHLIPIEKKNKEWVTLKIPFYEKKTKTWFSAGTSFAITEKMKNSIKISFYQNKGKIIQITIPNSYVLFHNALEDKTEKNLRKKFISLLYEWIDLAKKNNAIFPYLVGGMSIGQSYTGSFKTKEYPQENNKKILGYTWNDSTQPKMGIDCTGLVLLASKIIGFPFLIRNSSLYQKYLKPIQGKIKLGDIIAIPGHVCIIDPEKNMLIEARGYGCGHGMLHAVPLKSVFKDIDTADDLFAAWSNKKPLKMITGNGSRQDIIKNYGLFPLID